MKKGEGGGYRFQSDSEQVGIVKVFKGDCTSMMQPPGGPAGSGNSRVREDVAKFPDNRAQM
jgi:hypothetical protein